MVSTFVGHFYRASSPARNVLSEGVLALPMPLLRAQSKSTNVDTANVDHSADNVTLHSLSSESFFRNELFDKSKSPSDVFAIRQDYPQLIVKLAAINSRISQIEVLPSAGADLEAERALLKATPEAEVVKPQSISNTRL